MLSRNAQAQVSKIAIIGDIHDLWEPADEVALKHLGVDLVLFVGDFGNEAVEVVRAIACLDLPLAAVFGNHDAWFTATPWGVKQCPYDRTQEDRVQQQIDLLGPAHVGYRHRNFPALNLAVVGSRPFTWGGTDWKNAKFYRERFQVNSFAESTARIVAASRATAAETIILLGHNGPTGLGSRAEDPCGKDWAPIGGDYGDPDLEAAIAEIKRLGKQVPLVAFGHMHHSLRHTKTISRTPIQVDPDGTVYVNAACVPRIVPTPTGCRRNFTLVTLQAGKVTAIALTWMDQNLQVVAETLLYRQPDPLAQIV